MSYIFFCFVFKNKKPNREDEYARIEASGGKVIQWNGYRVFGVLAMSRSIGMHLGPVQYQLYCFFPIILIVFLAGICLIYSSPQ